MVESADGCGGWAGDAIEDAKQGVAEAVAVSQNEFWVVKVIPCVQLHAGRKTLAKIDFSFFIQQRNLDAVNFCGVLCNDFQTNLGSLVEVPGTLVPVESGLKHGA